MRDIPLSEIMVSNVVFARSQDSLRSVEEKMRIHGVRHMPIVDEDKKVVGIITYRDLIECAPPRHTQEGLVFDPVQLDPFILKYVMTSAPQTLSPTDTIAHAVAIMAREKYGCIPLTTSEGVLLGVVTQIDILRWLGKKLQEGDLNL